MQVLNERYHMHCPSVYNIGDKYRCWSLNFSNLPLSDFGINTSIVMIPASCGASY